MDKIFTFSLYNFIFILSSFTALVSSSFSPIDHHLINCGSQEATVLDLDHRRFTGDSSESGSRFLTSSAETIPLADANPLPNSSPLYLTARAFKRPSRYAFEITDRGTHHLVRLHFYRFNSSFLDLSAAQFHVLANGYLLLRDFSMVNSQNDVIVKEYIINAEADKLEITFVPAKSSKFAFVNAIEVISAPKDLINDLAQHVDSERNERISGLLKNGFETVYRVNVGGPKVTPFNGSLWRNWVPDDEYLKSGDGSSRIRFSGLINYQVGGASREVGPDNVYNSARVIKSSNGSIPMSRIMWLFPGIEHYKYLVRLHFCDIASIGLNLLYFNVYVNGNLAYENLDLSAMTNGLLASPFYADFVVDGVSSGVLAVSVGPSNRSLPQAVDAILNGVEILKISNAMNSFDGEVCSESLMKSWRSANASILYPLLAAVFLLLTASMVVSRRGTGARNALGFSRLPLGVSEVDMKSSSQLSVGKL